ncbi:MAG: NAD-dependent protein deacetylase [Gammaproteobacteria bacterium]|nr:NAD-dependent protein deacetylase [Gammaproteobacteria bacterium]
MLTQLTDFIETHPRLLVLTGAGCSAASGIPTYRDNKGDWQRSNPITHQDFISRVASRQRYWARSFVGWPPVRDAQPNSAHQALAELEEKGVVGLLVTQNVDRLHQKAGHAQVIDLHGRLDQVVCLSCDHIISRQEMQQQLTASNPQLAETPASWTLAPDGDADVADSLVERLQVPACRFCGGLLKPNVVFFGDSVKRDLVAHIADQLEASDGLLVVGSSLMVFSGYRFCRHAAQHNKPIACINAGKTRADELFQLKLEMDCGEALSTLADGASLC